MIIHVLGLYQIATKQILLLDIIMGSLHDAHEVNAYRADEVCLCPHDSTQTLDRFG
jgi:hypothetical protein